MLCFYYLATCNCLAFSKLFSEFTFNFSEIFIFILMHDTHSVFYFSYQPGKSKFHRKSPTSPLLVTTVPNTRVDDNRLPKVEELLEKVDYDMTEMKTKQPLKSILNNPIPKSPPPGILKKPKNKFYQDPKGTLEGRRRQRASSESDNLYNSFPVGSPIPGYDR